MGCRHAQARGRVLLRLRLLSISVTALVFIGKASAQHGGHVSGYESAARASL
jgi:hypothetical protein